MDTSKYNPKQTLWAKDFLKSMHKEVYSELTVWIVLIEQMWCSQ